MSDLLAFATPRRTARASLLGTWCDGGTIALYTAPRPTDADTAIGTATLLATIELPDPAGTTTDGTWSVSPLPDGALIVATGYAAWARVRDSSGVTIGDLSAGVPNSGAALILDTQDLVAGALVQPLALAITEG